MKTPLLAAIALSGPWLMLLPLLGATGRETSPATQPAAVAPPAAEGVLEILGKDARPLVEGVEGGEIDWTRGEVRAIGVGKMEGRGGADFAMAQRAARLAAARNAVLLMAGIPAGPGTRFSTVERGRITVDAIVRDFRETASDYDPKTATVTSTIAIPLYGASGVVRLIGVVPDKPAKRWNWPENKGGSPPEWVVLDARGSKFQPCMFPQVATEAGEVIFHASDFSGDDPARGPALYAQAAPKAEPVIKDALVIKVKSPGDKDASTLVLDKAALDALSARPSARETMKAGKTVIITGASPPAAGDEMK